jgi:hypothetical protein
VTVVTDVAVAAQPEFHRVSLAKRRQKERLKELKHSRRFSVPASVFHAQRKQQQEEEQERKPKPKQKQNPAKIDNNNDNSEAAAKDKNNQNGNGNEKAKKRIVKKKKYRIVKEVVRHKIGSKYKRILVRQKTDGHKKAQKLR